MQPANTIFIMSDEHKRSALGCAGHPMLRTPNLDRLAAAGTRFTAAYCNSPICVPSRASFATGRYVHQIGFWDNAIPYDGTIPSWAHRLREHGHPVVSIGKLHFRSAEDNNGFDEEIMPLHVVDGEGDVLGLIRDDPPPRISALKLAQEAGPGNSSYQDYDDAITQAAVTWLQRRTQAQAGKPWVLFVSLVCPHFPLISRPEWYGLYPEASVPMPTQYAPQERPDHPFIAAMREIQVYDRAFDQTRIRRAIAAYFGMVSFLDDNIGKILAALDATGLTASTRVIYASDHGDNLGNRGLWGKSNMYEDAAGIPLIMAGPDIPRDQICHAPVSLVDGFPTILHSAGVPPDPADAGCPGASLLHIARGHGAQRPAFSEYHATGSVTGAFLLRRGDFKLVYYVGMPPQLFDLARDPAEAHDLGQDPAYAGLVATLEAELRTICDPEATDQAARAKQRSRVEALGGRDAVLARGSFGYSPVPGTKPVYD
jgi:choline-sulfatase